jgi:hypothetical protein
LSSGNVRKLTNTDEGEGPVDEGDEKHLPISVGSLVCVSSKIGLDVSIHSYDQTRKEKRGRRTMFKARVVFPAMAILIPPTQAHDRADPVSLVFACKTGPPPPAVFTDHPRRAKAAMTAAIDLMKNNHLIFRGWIRTNGSWTVC